MGYDARRLRNIKSSTLPLARIRLLRQGLSPSRSAVALLIIVGYRTRVVAIPYLPCFGLATACVLPTPTSPTPNQDVSLHQKRW